MSIPSPNATFDPHTVVSGRVSGQDLAVMGAFEGELHLSGRLHAGAGSRLRARVRAAFVDLQGEFEGEIHAGTLLVAASARARGVFVAEHLSVQEGATLDGDVQTPPAPAVDRAATPPAAEAADKGKDQKKDKDVEAVSPA